MAALRDSPLAAFTELRFRLTWRRLLGRRGVGELVAKLIGYLLLLPVGAVAAIGIGAGTYAAARSGLRGGVSADVQVTAIFLGIWQAWTAATLALQDQESLDLRRYLLYPLRPGAVWLHGQVAGVLGDPLALFWCVLLGGAMVGAALGRFGAWLLPLALVVALFAVATLAWLALIQELGARVLRQARLKALLFAGVYVVLAVAIALVVGSDPHRLTLRESLSVFQWAQWLGWPGAMAAGAARRLFHGQTLAALPWMAALAGTTAASGWAAFRLALSEARDGGGGGVVRVGRSPGAVAGRLWPGPTGALLERELTFLTRHPLPLVLGVILPAVAGLIAWKTRPYVPAEAGEVVRALPILGVALYVHLATQSFWLNGFGWERGGARLYFLAPLRLERVLLAKNLAIGALGLAVHAGVGGGHDRGRRAAAGLGAGRHAGPPPGRGALVPGPGQRRGHLEPARGATHAAAERHPAGALGAGGDGDLLGRRRALRAAGAAGAPPRLGLAAPSRLAGLGGLGAWLWWRSLPAAARLLQARREELVAAVTGDEA